MDTTTTEAEANLVRASWAWDRAQAALRGTFVLDYGPGYPR